jgi:hypothetical protein
MEDETCFVGRSTVSRSRHDLRKGGTSPAEIDETLVNVSLDLLWEISRIGRDEHLTADPNKALQSRNTARPRGRREHLVG